MYRNLKVGGLVAVLALVCCSLLLAACGNVQTSAISHGEPNQRAATTDVQLESYQTNHSRVPANLSRTVTAAPVTSAQATLALQTWAGQTVGVNTSISEAKGLTTQVFASYQIPSQNYGVIQANINASRAAYAGGVANGGFELLLLGGGSDLSNQSVTVQIESASLGYLQFPATTYPTGSDAALTQIKQAFPALSGYTFTLTPSPQNNRFAYNFYAYDNTRSHNNISTSAVDAGVVQLNGHIWVYAMVGSGQYVTQIIP